MEFKDKIVVITGGAKGIGACMAEAFQTEGATLCLIDKLENPYFVGDIAEEATLRNFAEKVIADYGRVDVLINNAKPDMVGLETGSFDQFQYSLAVGVTAPFFLSKLFQPHFSQGASILNISSTRHKMSQPQSESYAAAKGGIVSLTHALASSLAGKVRVNSICPGWVDTTKGAFPPPEHEQHWAGRIGLPEDIAQLALFLASAKAGFITGQDICVDGGMTKKMMYLED